MFLFYFSKKTGNMMKKEAGIICQLRHVNIISFLGIILYKKAFAIALALAKYGSLDDFVDALEVAWKTKVNCNRIYLSYHSFIKISKSC